ncbi:hypothetical protein BHE74_00004294 [Ensete ventricosum]|nr:hypothetical protein BHE74_00004294 [Ensete ventricosum]
MLPVPYTHPPPRHHQHPDRSAFSRPNSLTYATSHLLDLEHVPLCLLSPKHPHRRHLPPPHPSSTWQYLAIEEEEEKAPKAGAVGASNGSGQAEESIRSRRMAVHLSRGIEPLIVECTPDAYLEDPLLSRFGSHKIVERYSSGSDLDAYLAKVNKHTRTHPLVDLLTVASDLSVAPSEWTNVPHVDHGGSKALEEGALVACKAVDGGNSGGPAGREELLVGLQQPLVTLQVGEVVVVEGVGRGEIEIVEGCAVSSLGAVLLQSLQVGGVQRRVRAAGAAEVVEPAAEEAALRAAELKALPDKATRSVSSRPTSENFCLRVSKSSKGLGMLLAAVGIYQVDGSFGSEGEDVSAGNDARANVLHRGLDVVDHIEPSHRVLVRQRVLLALYAVTVIQQNGTVATLQHNTATVHAAYD